ncbi:MAG: hypothetical protein DI547_05755 [Sphingobium sp.]|nr:MAG: hypothetical protein DI547_05755 [Sphingobium sp.]
MAVRNGHGIVAAGALLLILSACNSSQRSTLEQAADGASEPLVEQSVKAEAQNIMAPLNPPAPGTPGGLPDEPAPPAEGTIDPESAQGAAQLVQGYYGLLEEKRFADAQDLWNEESPNGKEDPALFTARFRGFSEIHANIGTPDDPEGAAGSVYVTVPVQVYARVTATGKPYYALRAVSLRRVNDVDGATQEQRRWHIEDIGPFPPPAAPAADAAATPGRSTH